MFSCTYNIVVDLDELSMQEIGTHEVGDVQFTVGAMLNAIER
jgi:hypothetical protein